MSKAVFFFFLFFGSTGLVGQQHLLEKYDAYKKRLHDEFVVIDWTSDGIGSYQEELGYYSQAGNSLPCSGIFPIDKANELWEFHTTNCQDNKNITNSPTVKKWADGTLHLGYYWAVLATEYALHKRDGKNREAEKTAHELFLALQAYRRLDFTGQQIAKSWNEEEEKRCKIDLPFTGYSGFYIRDDVPSNYREISGVGAIISSMACRKDPIDFFKKEGKGNVISQDQNAYLLLGLGMIYKAFDDEVFLINGQEVNISSVARKISYGIVSHVHQSSTRRIKFPACRKGIVQTGGNSIGFAFAMNKFLDHIAPGHRVRSTFWDRVMWELIAEDITVVLGKALGLAKNDNIAMYLCYCASADMESMSDVVSIALSASQKEIFPLAKAYIHDYPLSSLPKGFSKDFLQLIQSCPIVGTGLDAKDLSDDWHYDNRWRTYDKKPPYAGRGNGLDFMLACNLYRLYFDSAQ